MSYFHVLAKAVQRSQRHTRKYTTETQNRDDANFVVTNKIDTVTTIHFQLHLACHYVRSIVTSYTTELNVLITFRLSVLCSYEDI